MNECGQKRERWNTEIICHLLYYVNMLYQTFVIADLIFTGYNAATLNVFILRYLESLCWPELDIKKKRNWNPSISPFSFFMEIMYLPQIWITLINWRLKFLVSTCRSVCVCERGRKKLGKSSSLIFSCINFRYTKCQHKLRTWAKI